jgi:site-specific DNA-methyltransferase (adenine-specific)/adenine-specific DNA-methyltransferase
VSQLTEAEKEKLCALIRAGEPLPAQWRARLFPGSDKSPEAGKEYRLVYDGKMRREEVLAQTPAAPWQLVRSFCAERPHADKRWRNLLVWGDNLLALRELLTDQQGPNRFGTRGKIKLIYIDPPFATRQDFMKDKEKAYRDKVLGAQFIEFLRRRLILLRELLADDGSIFVHLDWKKGHYLKAALDEVFGEENFVTEIVWRRTTAHFTAERFAFVHDSLFQYSRGEKFIFRKPPAHHSSEYLAVKYKNADADGRRYRLSDASGAGQGQPRVFFGRKISPPEGRHWASQKYIDEHFDEYVLGEDGMPQKKSYLKGATIGSVWDDISPINSQAEERLDYPTQKPEELLERVIYSSSNEGDIVLDCFAGSGTAAATAEKLNRRWIAMDCGKLAIYTTQKRLFALTRNIGSSKKDERTEPERVEDWNEHLKNAPGIMLITEKARKGECEVTLELLHDLAALIQKHGLLKKDAALSLVCPEEKLRVPADRLEEVEDDAGARQIAVGGVAFRISFIPARDKTEKEKPLPAKEFALYRAGIYDMAAVKQMSWADYRPFVLKLFGVREHPHARYGFALDGYIGTDSALIWNFPDHKKLTLDHGYVDDLHRTLRGKPDEKYFVIAPVVAMDFAEDEVVRDQTTYVFLKVPLSVLMRLIEKHEPAALKQPTKEEDVNEVIDAVGFDFISQPQVEVKAKKRRDGLLKEMALEIRAFRAQTLATDPEDFKNFETFSMAMVDLNYDGDVFRLGRVFWAEDLIAEEIKRIKAERKAAAKTKADKEKEPNVQIEDCELLLVRIPEEDFTGRKMMVLLCDRYGNEKTLVFEKRDFK